MQSLKFKQLLLISNPTKSANLFNFQKDLTIITADDNNYGKSTLGKLLFWSLGCDPDFDTNWNNLDCKTILKFTIGENKYETMRYKDLIYLNENGESTLYPKITGAYSDKIGQILGFHALMPKRDTVILETPPPAYFFVPFYIDQKKSWATAWENFSNLGQYQNWKPTIIKYHIGLLPKTHFELELKKSSKKVEKSALDIEITKLEATLEIVSKFISTPVATINQVKLEKITSEIRDDLKRLSEFQEKTLDEFTKLQGDRAFLYHQKIISEKIIIELDKDYKYAVEHFPEDEIQCPLCGIHHENSVINRASILTDRQQAESQLDQISLTLSTTESKLEKIGAKVERTRSDIELIHNKYLIEEGTNEITLNEIIENIAGNSIQENVKNSRADKLVSLLSLNSEIKQINDDQKALLTEEEKRDINDMFLKIFSSYIELLGAEDINTSEVNSPLDYGKIIREGGAAEGIRGILAYYLAIHTMIENSGNEVLAPMIIDTPNQQEQSLGNYDKILELIKKKVSPKSQIILCALKNEKLDILNEDANIIHLSEKRLLSEEKYHEIKKEFDRYKLNNTDNKTSENDKDEEK
ncbi:hypothetical protein QG516_20800 [Pedobacter gandavensis]|uniref:hypothetical protein n=1 Tax=Pedobacter gandavensis TaxID=2679963 RepID=UPI002479FAC6|nr:hypothetical protein [Pedobacter gandavensis]WGQ08955.1 hypothetical protein QG516_20800 [Pedobacter gandavensis]